MSLSNTAVPKYYGMFREMVLRGEIPVCETISLEMNRIDGLIANPRYYYDEDAVEGWIAFCEGELVLEDGSDLTLLDSFKLWAEQVYGWWYFEERSVYVPDPDHHGGHYETKRFKRRLVTTQYLIIPRSNAKTLYEECHQAYGLIIDGATTHQVTTAPVMKQAEELMGPFRTAITKSKGPLFKFMTMGSIQNTTGNRANRPMLCSTKIGIQNFTNGSYLEIRPMRIDKLQGLRVKYSTIDEWLSCDISENVMNPLRQGAAKTGD